MAEGICVGLHIKHTWLRGELEMLLASQPDMRLQPAEHTGAPDFMILEVEDDPTRTFALVHSLLNTAPATEIFLTAERTDPEVLLAAMRAGVKEFLPQPLKSDDLDRALQRFRERHRPREMPPAKRGKLFNIMGSKGGIGTTTIAVNLAISLQEANAHRSVVLVDLSQPFGDAALFLDLEPTHTLGDIARNMARLDEAFLQGVLARHASGLAILPSVYGDEELGLLTPACVEQTIALLQVSFDYIVLDSGHALDDITVTTLALAPLFLVTTSALPVLRHTKRFLDLLRTNLEYTPENINVIVNRYKSKYQEVSLADFQEVLQQKAVWWLPNDYYTTSQAINRGEPLSAIARHAKITRSFQGLAASLVLEDSKKPSLFSRFFRKKEA